MLAPKRDEVIEVWRKLHNAEPNNLYSLLYYQNSLGLVFSIRWREGNGYKVLIGKFDGNRSLERHEQMVG
jgi:hypothetical protein